MTSTTTNKYEHPQLLKGVRIVREGVDDLTGFNGEIVRCPYAVLWQDVVKLEVLALPKLVLKDETLGEPVACVTLNGGLILYVLDPYSDVLAAWELYLNAASLGHKSLLSN